MWTDKGVASLATYIQQLHMYENALDEVSRKLDDDYSLPYSGNEAHYKELGIDSEQELYDAREKLIEQQYDYQKGISDTQQSVADMYESQIDAVEEYTNELVDAYNDYIDVVKEALDAERDLYDFKKNVQKQTKDIAALERRIASLSGSDNASDIAERRKLEAELYEAREGLNDTYYDHAKDAQQQALEDEATAYEESMNKFIEGLRTSLESALLDMDLFMQGVTSAVISNAPAIVEQYNGLGIALDSAIIDPWTEAANAIKTFGGVDGLGMMNAWITEGGIFPTFKTSATDALKSPWTTATEVANSFKTNVANTMAQIVENVKSNIATTKQEVSSLYSQIKDTPAVSANTGDTDDTVKKNLGGRYKTGADVTNLQKIMNMFFGAKLNVNGVYDPTTKSAVTKMQKKLNDMGFSVGDTDGKYGSQTFEGLKKFLNAYPYINSWFRDNKVSIPAAMYAKGTMGTPHDQFAITDESWIGEEITLAAGKNGQLQYLKKGSAVMPADISANLVEWGKLNPNMMNVSGVGANLNMISNAIIQPNLDISFDALVKAENITEETLPAVKKLVSQELDRFTKQLNYSLKRVGGR